MLAKNPAHDVGKMSQTDLQVLRTAIEAELDAVSLYEQLAFQADNPLVKEVLLDVAREEKVHAGEFLEVLKDLDPELVKSLEEGRDEVLEMKGK